MLTALGARARAWASASDPFTNVYGLARTVLATATALTLLFNDTSTLFRPGAGIDEVPVCVGVRAAGAFCLGAPHLEAVRWLAIALLVVIASGYRPRFTGALHAWIAFSLQANALTIEGGDQVSAILTLLLVPVTLLDDRAWHWQPRRAPRPGAREDARRLVARVCFTLIRVQVAGIYFHAAVGKFAVQEWTDGTVLYYWLTHPMFGVPAWLSPIVRPALLHGGVVALVTWSVLAVEYALSAGLLVARRNKGLLLALGLALHGGIALLHGLVTFAITMAAALVLYLRPLDRTFSLPRARCVAAALARLALAAPPEGLPTRAKVG